jgi:alpha-D-ribose 1-methylphosphonate 5-triphosphate synthase subunit PhnG
MPAATPDTLPDAHSHHLSVLSRAQAEPLKLLADALIPALEPITVMYNRTGLVMLPYADTAQGATFHLGEVLIAEARIQAAGSHEGYGACLGHDLEQALAMALLDVALCAGLHVETITAFIAEQERLLLQADETLLRNVESTRAEMETF